MTPWRKPDQTVLHYQFTDIINFYSLYGWNEASLWRKMSFVYSMVVRICLLISAFYYDWNRNEYFCFNYSIFSAMSKPLIQIAFNLTFTMHNIICGALSFTFTQNRHRLISLFIRQCKFTSPHLNHFPRRILISTRAFVHLCFNIFCFSSFLDQKNYTLELAFVFSSSYFSAIHFVFFQDLYYCTFATFNCILKNQVQKIKPTKEFLSQKTTQEIIDIVRCVGNELIELNRIFVFPLVFTLVILTLMDICSINYFFILIPLSTRVFVVTNQLLNICSLYLLASLTQSCDDEFKRVHELLLDRAIETSSQFHSRLQKHCKAVTVDNAIRVYELRVYHANFKINILGLFAFDMRTFGLICVFILNYLVLLIQTSTQ